MTAITDYSHGISAIDSAYVRPNLDAIHLIAEGGRAALVDTGNNRSVALMLDALAAKNISPDAVDYVILTHVHLDHAGGAGLLMSKLPNARLVVHPRGARHMIDPVKLIAGTIAVYGAQAAHELYGEIVAVPAQRVMEIGDDAGISLNGRELRFYHTPGHAMHHVCIRDGATGHLFSGDMFGLSYRELDRDGKQFVFPSTTPVQFDPQAFRASIARMMALQPQAVYMTHYGKVGDLPRITGDLLRLLDVHVETAQRVARMAAGPQRTALLQRELENVALAEARRQGWTLSPEEVLAVLGMDIKLNAAGLDYWITTGMK